MLPHRSKYDRQFVKLRCSAVTLVELLVVLAIVGLAVALLLPSVRTAREPARRNQCLNNLKQIAIALQNYAEHHGGFPPAYTVDADGKPLHSWRTLILPYMEEGTIYDSIDLKKPWDDPANAAALKAIPYIYRCPSADIEGNLTTYLAVVTPGSCFRATETGVLSSRENPDAKLLVLEVHASHAVPWMSPMDADEKLLATIGDPKSKSPHVNGMNAVFSDASTQFLTEEISAAELLKLASREDRKPNEGNNGE